MRAALVIVALSLCSGRAPAQEFRPYPQSHVTEAQWQSYYDEVRSKYGASARVAPNQPLVVFDDGKSALYAFTQPGHPAHPSWVARRVVEEGGQLKLAMAGYFAGDERAFAALFQAYAALGAQVREHVQREVQRSQQ